MLIEHAEPFIGVSDAIRALYLEAVSLQDDPLPVLILGEPGVGKAALARWLHDRGPRRTEPFLEITCARDRHQELELELFGSAGPPRDVGRPPRAGSLESVRNGTVLFSEIGDLGLALQTRIAWVLQTREFHRNGGTRAVRAGFRVVASSRQDLDSLVRRQLFRWDLYTQLSSRVLVIPPLRHRREDVPVLAERILRQVQEARGGRPLGISDAALHLLADQGWPGNVRELRLWIEGAAARRGTGLLQPEDLSPDAPGPRAPDPPSRFETMRREIQDLLAGNGSWLPEPEPRSTRRP